MFKKITNWLKEKWKQIVALIIGGTCLAAVNDITVNDVSQIKLAEKYDLATQIKTNYSLEGSSLKREVKSDPRDRIEVVLGDPTRTDFIPEMKIMRWDNEVSFKIKPNLKGIAIKNRRLDFVGSKVKFQTPNIDYEMYELPISEENPEGAFEYEIILKKKPVSNIITLDIETQGLDFFYQPELTQQEKDEGANRPENVVGSYAVYTSEQKTNWVGGKLYKVGKFGHIFRPKIIDSAGKEIWGILNIDKGILSVEIPQKFLDGAVYPIKHAAGLTFGYETAGASYTTIQNNEMRGSLFTCPSAGTGDSITFYGSGTASGKGIIALHSTLNIITNGIGNGIAAGYPAAAWVTSAFATSPTLSATTDYVLMIVSNGAITYYRDTGDADQGHEDTTNNYTTPTNPTDATHTTNKYSIYATYTAAGAAAPYINRSQIIED